MRKLALILATLILSGIALSDSTPIVRSFPLNYSGAVDVNLPGTPTACWDFESAVGNYTDDCAATYTLTQTGTCVKTEDGTWPAGLSGSQGNNWTFDGNDYLTRTDDGTFDPAGDFSIQLVYTTHDVSETDTIVAKDDTTNRSWLLYQYATGNLDFMVWKTGGTSSNQAKTSALSNHRPAFITLVYDYVSDGSSELHIYVDNLSTASNTSAVGPVRDTSAPLSVGAYGSGSNSLHGALSHFAYYDGTVITEAQHDQMFAQWQGRLSTAGNKVTITSAAPPAIPPAAPASGNQPFLIDMPANSFQVGSPASGSGGLYGAAAITNLCQRSSVETWAAGAPTGWTEAVTSTGDCAEQTTAVAHGGSSARCTLADADDAVTLTGACLDTAVSTAYYVSAYATLVSGTGLLDINIIEDNDAGCGSPHTTTAVVDDAVPTGDWVKYGGTITTQANGDYAQVQIPLPAAAAQELDIDAIQLRVASTPTDAYCGADTDASAACNHVIPSIANPLIPGTWQIEYNIRTPWAGNTGTQLETFYVLATAGNSNKIFLDKFSDDELYIRVYDSAGAQKNKSIDVSATWAADTEYPITVWHTPDGRIGGSFNGNAFDTGAGVDAVTDGMHGTFYFSGRDNAAKDIWTNSLKSLRRYQP